MVWSRPQLKHKEGVPGYVETESATQQNSYRADQHQHVQQQSTTTHHGGTYCSLGCLTNSHLFLKVPGPKSFENNNVRQTCKCSALRLVVVLSDQPGV